MNLRENAARGALYFISLFGKRPLFEPLIIKDIVAAATMELSESNLIKAAGEGQLAAVEYYLKFSDIEDEAMEDYDIPEDELPVPPVLERQLAVLGPPRRAIDEAAKAAAEAGYFEVVEYLWARGARLDIPSDIESRQLADDLAISKV